MQRRGFLLAATTSVVAACGLARIPSSRFDSVVCRDRQRRFGIPAYSTIAAALQAARDAKGPQRILIAEGIHDERVVIDRAEIELVGEHRERSIIRGAVAAGTPGYDGQPLGTWGCATVIVRAAGFSASRLCIENAFDYVGELTRPTLPAIGSNGPQAVALMLADGSDRARFDGVDIRGHQDTLFADAGRSAFRDCRISGSVDFIFGAGHAVFDACELLSRFRPGKARQGYVAAPSTMRDQPFGLVFRRCRLTAEAHVPAGTVALGRAWRPARNFADGHYGDPDAIGAAAFIDCELGAHIAAEGWDAMKYTALDGSRVELLPRDARFVEYANHGPGANPARPQWTRAQFDDAVRQGLFAAGAARASRPAQAW